MKILAIDPGVDCGWAFYKDGNLFSGCWNLKGNRFEGGGMRFVRFNNYLSDLGQIDRFFFEEVRRHMGTDAAHMYGGIMAQIQLYCETKDPQVPYMGLPVKTVKKHATGNGNAGKPLMISTAIKKWPDQDIGENDNIADALWMLDYGLIENCRIKPKYDNF